MRPMSRAEQRPPYKRKKPHKDPQQERSLKDHADRIEGGPAYGGLDRSPEGEVMPASRPPRSGEQDLRASNCRGDAERLKER